MLKELIAEPVSITNESRPNTWHSERLGAFRGLPTPKPVPSEEAYIKERELALADSPECRKNYAKYLRSERGNGDIDYLPVKLDIENVSRCNFSCTFCAVSDWPKRQRAGDMSLAEFKRLLAEFHGLVEIKIQGLGEPTIQGDDYFAMIRHARDRHIWVRTASNGSLLHLKDNDRKLIDSGVNEIQLSVDGTDKNTFEQIRRGAVFEQVLKNMETVNAYCAAQNVERTKMWTVLNQHNIHQRFEFVDMAHQLGFKHVAFALNMNNWWTDDWSKRIGDMSIEEQFDPADGHEMVEQGKALGIKVGFWLTLSKYKTDRPENLCPWPFDRTLVTSDSRVVPCCKIANPDVFEIDDGDRDAGYKDLWTGPAYKSFREAHLSGDIPKVCRDCYVGDTDRN